MFWRPGEYGSSGRAGGAGLQLPSTDADRDPRSAAVADGWPGGRGAGRRGGPRLPRAGRLGPPQLLRRRRHPGPAVGLDVRSPRYRDGGEGVESEPQPR
ncbi:MAG: hypothetical protein E6I86_03605 [Chloroflexi bacterium]|nr:MAG: hypothetical protein E6I86_03605 [Chloroflexota bacterium]